jgi:phosphoglycolate phosphatase-like HAD superfamily hydrolase
MPLDTARIDAILFDVDGTLSDTDDRFVRRLQQRLNGVRFFFPGGQTLPAARWLVMTAESPANRLYGLLDRLHLDDEAGRLVNFLARRHTDSPGRFLMIPQVDALLAALHAHYLLAVVSAGSEQATLGFLERFDLAPYFEAVATSFTCPRTKPFPDPLLWAAGRLGVPPERCLMVGDTTVDIRAGKAAGAQTVGVLCGFGTERELRRAGADLILPDTSALRQTLLGELE